MERKMKIFLVEDDVALADEVRQFLEKWGYAAVKADCFEDIVSDFQRHSPNLVLLDINLPFFDGFYWCAQIRKVSDVPILFISSKNDDMDKIMAIAQGGDDYVEKPFGLALLKAKIDAALRRAYQYKVRERVLLGAGLSFEQDTFSLFYQERELDLTKSEKKIMGKLLECKPSVVLREELMMELWGMDEFVSDGTLTTLISRLRNKLKEICGEEIIQTKKGQGYFIA